MDETSTRRHSNRLRVSHSIQESLINPSQIIIKMELNVVKYDGIILTGSNEFHEGRNGGRGRRGRNRGRGNLQGGRVVNA